MCINNLVDCKFIFRLNQLLCSKENSADIPAQSPRSGREAHIKLRALNKATVKMVSQLEALEEENKSLKQKLEKVSISHIIIEPVGILN